MSSRSPNGKDENERYTPLSQRMGIKRDSPPKTAILKSKIDEAKLFSFGVPKQSPVALGDTPAFEILTIKPYEAKPLNINSIKLDKRIPDGALNLNQE